MQLPASQNLADLLPRLCSIVWVLCVQVLSKLSKSKNTVSTTVEFVDIAGLVKGASKGEGLGNKFLGNIRECDAIVQARTT